MFGLGGDQSTKRGAFESELGNSMEAGVIGHDSKSGGGGGMKSLLNKNEGDKVTQSMIMVD